jgi:hypothetical protein
MLAGKGLVVHVLLLRPGGVGSALKISFDLNPLPREALEVQHAQRLPVLGSGSAAGPEGCLSWARAQLLGPRVACLGLGLNCCMLTDQLLAVAFHR